MLARIVLSIFLSLGFGFLTQPLQAQTVLDTVCAGARGVNYRVLNNTGSGYLWNVQGGVIADGNGSNEVAVDWGKDTGVFPIEVIQYNQNGCPGDTVRAFVWIRPGISTAIEGPKVICEGDEVVLHAFGAKSYIWNTGYTGQSLHIIPTESNNYRVVGYSDLCGNDTAYFSLPVNKRPKAAITIYPHDPKLNEVILFTSDESKRADSIIWNINQGSIIVQGEEAYHSFPSIGNQKVQLIVIDPNGCADSAFVSFYIDALPQIYIPNAFTPDGDGLNDSFSVTANNTEYIHMQVYNRWGQLVFDGTNEKASWDGNYKGIIAEEGVYVYQIKALGLNKQTYEYNGTLTLMR
ncbi:MAG TPA: hypothetical protein DIW47_00285 [Bacteroidetes bacterium]|nr:hypothetical protein [Bacteroidota bacterium]